jgi:hypothetical protein
MRFLSLWAVVMLTACAAAQPLVVENTCSGFIIGKSTKAEVLNKCGQPSVHTDMTTGSALLFVTSGLGTRHIQNFGFDEQGILTSVSGS